jgi:gamma-glutamyl hercynylcysteine S-oxide hydrolase
VCRIAAYVGPPRRLDALLYAAPHSLHEQAYAPREQRHGTISVDGTGVVWWPQDGGDPLRYATTAPPWSDQNLRELAPHLEGRAIVAAVRGATPGMPFGRAAVAPFRIDGLGIAHNGWIAGFRDGVGPRLMAGLPHRWLTAIEVLSDSSLLAALVAARRDAGTDLLDAVAETVAHVGAVCHALGQPATLNLVVGDGRRIVASRASVATACNSLYVLTDGGAAWPQAALVASEPLDDLAWKPVPADHLVELRPDGHRSFPIDLGASP